MNSAINGEHRHAMLLGINLGVGLLVHETACSPPKWFNQLMVVFHSSSFSISLSTFGMVFFILDIFASHLKFFLYYTF